MKLMIHKTPTHKDFFREVSGKEKEKAAIGAVIKQKWRISFHRSSSANVSKTSQAQPKQTPKEFFCPISGSLMADPVIVPSGHTFERACKSLEFTPTFQDDSIPDFSTVIPNLALKSTILNWCQNHSLNPPKPLELSTAEELVRKLIAKKPNTQIEKEEKKVSSSEEELIQGVKDSPSVKLDHALTELTRRPTHFHSSSEESVTAATTTNVVTPPLQIATCPSCYSSASSSSKIETLTPNINEEEFFLTKLKSPQVFDVEEAVVALRKITRTQESSRVVLCTPRVLLAFRSLIMSRYVNIQVNSIAALVNLSLEKVNKVKIVRSGLVPILINVLKAGSPEAQEHASGALFSLTLDDDNKTAIGVLGALQPLMHMLRSGSERTRHDSALALCHLSLVQSNRSKLVKIGSVPVLLSMVKSGHMTGRVMLILCNLASGSDGRAAVLDSGGVECLVSLLRGSELDESTREGFVAILYGLSHGGLRFKGLAKAAGAVEELVKVERTGSEPARYKARRILEMLKGRSEEEQEDMDWEVLLDSGFNRSRFRLGGGKDGSCVNSSEF
ncbi:hypothetical protein CRYUN_Cryun17cG0026200 [Craigia yunnanensis]